jgi:hypothetical protein
MAVDIVRQGDTSRKVAKRVIGETASIDCKDRGGRRGAVVPATYARQE